MPLQEFKQRIGSSELVGYGLPLTQAQLSTNSDALVVDTDLDIGPFDLVAYSTICATNAVIVTMQGANLSDFSDAASLHTATLVAGATNAFSPNTTGYVVHRFIRVLIRSAVAGAHGSVRVSIVVKRKSRFA